MKKFKKTLAIMIAAALICGLCSCSGKSKADNSAGGDTAVSSVEEVTIQWTDCASLEDAEKIAGFKSTLEAEIFDAPSNNERYMSYIMDSSLYYEAKSYRAAEGLIETVYEDCDGNDMVVVESQDDLSKYYDDYSSEEERFIYYDDGNVSYTYKRNNDENAELVLFALNDRYYALSSGVTYDYYREVLIQSVVKESLGHVRSSSLFGVAFEKLVGEYECTYTVETPLDYTCSIVVDGDDAVMTIKRYSNVVYSGKLVKVSENFYTIEGTDADVTTYESTNSFYIDVHDSGKHLVTFWAMSEEY